MRFHDRKRLFQVLSALKECSSVLERVRAGDKRGDFDDLEEVGKAVDVGMMLLFRFYTAETKEPN